MLTIIIPYYKIIFFEATLHSLANQTNKQFKVFIGDDASPENPNKLLEKYKGQFDFVYKRFDTNLGGISLVKQWERCIALSNNQEWIMILGDDDYLENNVVEEFYKQINEIQRSKSNVVRFATKTVIDTILSLPFTHPKLEKATDFLFKKLSGETRSSLSEYVFNTTKLVEVTFKDLPLAWHSDELAILEVSNFSSIYTINEAIVFINVSEHSISGNKTNTKLKNKATIEFLRICLDKYSRNFTKKQLSQLLVHLTNAYFKEQSLYLFFVVMKYHFKYSSKFVVIEFFKKHLRKLLH